MTPFMAEEALGFFLQVEKLGQIGSSSLAM